MGKSTGERDGRATRLEWTILSAAAPPQGWTLVYAEPLEVEGGPYPAGVRLYTEPAYALVVVREVEYFTDDGKAVPGAEWERVELLDWASQSEGFWPWELDDFLGCAPPDHRFREGDRFWVAAKRYWSEEAERHRVSMARAEEFVKRRREAS